MKPKIAVWAAQIRAPFLLLAVALVLIGGALAHEYGQFGFLLFFLCLAGTVLAHASVNLFNELSDFRTGIDSITRRTPFSGGSGNLQAGLTSEWGVRIAAWCTLALAGAIGLYLAWRSGWILLVFILVGGLTTVFYTSRLAKFAMGELFAGMCLGSMVVVGTFIAMTGELNTTVLLASVPPGILTSLLLFLNEFPDLQADSSGGRRHLLIVLGRSVSARVYTVSLGVCYGFIVWGVASGVFPVPMLITLLTLPLAFKAAVITLKHHDDFEKMIAAQGANVGLVLGIDFLMAIAYFIH
ncbi:1,4-dihydroxy-2-naphthoate octaprenyltransferase [bacterium BMS3Abin14]|nr:1,4-dihydroxy-2-naphthoate octaprenyltransferase [bacterium BMS3Abin14]